jgi:hypothetical protein
MIGINDFRKKPPLCKCGCGEKVGWGSVYNRWNKCIAGHQSKWYWSQPRAHRKNKMLPCSCGCGLKTTGREKITIKGSLFIKGHEKRGINNHEKYLKEKEKEREKQWINGKWPLHKEIIKYNTDLIKEGKFKVNIENAGERCWSCGRKNPDLIRAHVIARRHSHENNHPSNIWLLCSGCHVVQPDNVSREKQLKWIAKMPRLGSQCSTFEYSKNVMSVLADRWGIKQNSPIFDEILFFFMKLNQEVEITQWHEREEKAYKEWEERIAFIGKSK